jgi:hypothetical protein
LIISAAGEFASAPQGTPKKDEFAGLVARCQTTRQALNTGDKLEK